jgi:hypothetical protein
MALENMEGGENKEGEQRGKDMEEFAQELAEKMAKKFEDEWSPAMEALDIAEQVRGVGCEDVKVGCHALACEDVKVGCPCSCL